MIAVVSYDVFGSSVVVVDYNQICYYNHMTFSCNLRDYTSSSDMTLLSSLVCYRNLCFHLHVIGSLTHFDM